MTVYNVTRLRPGVAKVVAEYFGVSERQVEIRYSDWFNAVGPYVKDKLKRTSIPIEKRRIAKQFVDKEYALMFLSDDMLKCPVVNKSN